MDNDVLLNITKHNAISRETDELISKRKSRLPSRNTKETTVTEFNDIVFKYHCRAQLPIFYRYAPIRKYEVLNISSQKIYMTPADKMNDYLEGSVTLCLRTDEAARLKEMHLKCFTVNPCDVLMWSHYGNSHRGICVGYNFNDLERNNDMLNHLYPVQYSKKRFTARHPHDLITNEYFFLRKGLCWDYEKEWRLLYKEEDLPVNPSSGKPENLLELDCIKEITFGLGCRKANMKKVYESTGDHIDFFKIEVQDGTFELTRKRIAKWEY